MKTKSNLVILATMLVAQGAFSSGMGSGDMSSIMISMSPMSTAQATSGGIDYENDILLVKQDAMVALETGVISEDLASVMSKMQTVDSTLSALTDEQLLLVILQSN